MAVNSHISLRTRGSIVNTGNHSQLAAFIWSVADLLRGDFKQSQYGRIILPFTLLRRLECVLEPTKADVLTAAREHQAKPDAVREKLLLRAAVQPFFNASPLTLGTLSDTQTADDLMSYVQSAFFDPKAPASSLSYYCRPAQDRFKHKYQALLEQQQTWKEARRIAEQNGDDKGLKRAEQELKEAGTAQDELDLFRKNLQSFVRTYEFLSQIVTFDDPELEQLCVYARHLVPLLRTDRLLEEESIDVSELELTHYRLTKREEKRLRLEEAEGDYGLTPVSEVGSGKPFDPEKQRLAEIIDRLNDLYGAEVSDDDKLHFANGIADRIERDEAVMAQVRNHSEDQVMHGLFPKKVTDAVLDALSDHEKLSMPLLEDEETGRKFALLILKLLAGRSGREVYAVK